MRLGVSKRRRNNQDLTKVKIKNNNVNLVMEGIWIVGAIQISD